MHHVAHLSWWLYDTALHRVHPSKSTYMRNIPRPGAPTARHCRSHPWPWAGAGGAAAAARGGGGAGDCGQGRTAGACPLSSGRTWTGPVSWRREYIPALSPFFENHKQLISYWGSCFTEGWGRSPYLCLCLCVNQSTFHAHALCGVARRCGHATSLFHKHPSGAVRLGWESCAPLAPRPHLRARTRS